MARECSFYGDGASARASAVAGLAEVRGTLGRRPTIWAFAVWSRRVDPPPLFQGSAGFRGAGHIAGSRRRWTGKVLRRAVSAKVSRTAANDDTDAPRDILVPPSVARRASACRFHRR